MHFLYLDDRITATAGSGILVDATASPPPRAAVDHARTRSYALTRAMQWWAGDPAREDQITAAGNQVKARPNHARHGMPDPRNRICRTELGHTGVTGRDRAFTDFGDVPSNSQLGLSSVACAGGPMFDLPEVNRIKTHGSRNRKPFSNTAGAGTYSMGSDVSVRPETV